MHFRHLTEAKKQLAMMKDMLCEQRAMRQQTSELAPVGSRLGGSAGGLSQQVTDQAAGGTRPLNTSQWYDCVYCSV